MVASGMLGVTRSSQINFDDSRYRQVLGIARTIPSELLLDFAYLEIEIVDEVPLQAIVKAFNRL